MLRVCNGLAEHPRLILTSDRINFISTLPSSTDPFAVLFVSRTIQQSESSIQRLYYRNSVNENSAPDARYIVQDVYNLAVTSALTKNSTYSLCGCELFLRAALNPSWDTNNSIPQLNTGEMLHIIGLAFDWFYDLLTPENRSDVVKAISEHLLLIKDALSSTPPSWSTAFVNTSSNWNMVILSGTIIASLAIEGESGEPDWTTSLWAHTHLDGGSFVFVTQGQYFAQDLSSDEYSAPGYFSPTRFNLYRTNVSGHNTISFAGRNPLCKVISTYSSDCPPSPMTVFNITGKSDDVSAFSVVNLTEGFVRAPILGVQRVERGFIVGKEQSQLVTVDEVDFNQTIPTLPLWWTMHTVANISIQNSTLLTLTTWNTTAIIKISILNSSNCLDAQFTISPLNLVPPLLPSPEINVIRIVAPASSCKRLVVAIGEDPPSFHYSSIRPISEWREYGPFS